MKTKPKKTFETKAFNKGVKVAVRRKFLSSDEIWQEGLKKPREPRSLGPVLIKLQKHRVIEKFGWKQTTQATRHGAPIRVWKSLIYNEKSASR